MIQPIKQFSWLQSVQAVVIKGILFALKRESLDLNVWILTSQRETLRLTVEPFQIERLEGADWKPAVWLNAADLVPAHGSFDVF